MGIRQNTWNLGGHYDLTNSGQNAYVGLNSLFSWGRNSSGQLGQNSIVYYSSPVQIPGTQWSKIASGAYSSASIKTDGTLWSWGYNGYGTLGQNNTTDRSSPVQIPGTQWSSCECGYLSSYALKSDGTLWGIGYNGIGQLGQNDRINHSSPVQIPGTQWSLIKAETNDAFATKTDGTLWAWGINSFGILAQNNTTPRSSPVQIPGTSWANKLAFGYNGPALVTKTDGTLWSWGYNPYGGLGQNDTINRSSPVQIPGTQWKNVASANYNGFATKTDGTLWAWGHNPYGQLGQNNIVYYSSPRQIPGTQWNTIEGALYTGYSIIATKTDGSLWAWGYNNAGQLSQNNKVNYSSPIQIPGTQWSTIIDNGNKNVLILLQQ